MGQRFTICSAKSDFKDFRNKNTKLGTAAANTLISHLSYFKEF